LAVLALVLCYFATISAQPTRQGSRPRTKPAPTIPASKPATETEALEKALAETDSETRAEALKGFLKDFPNSEKVAAAKALLVTALAAAANVKMQVGDTEGGIAMFREAIEAAPTPIPENLFSETVGKIVPSLYFHGEQQDAIELAGVLEPKIQTNLTQLQSLGTFYASIENGAGAKRIAYAQWSSNRPRHRHICS